MGFILGVVIVLEVGDVTRFPTASHLASYAGTIPRVHSSGDKTRYGQLRGDVNRYLKWPALGGGKHHLSSAPLLSQSAHQPQPEADQPLAEALCSDSVP